MSRRLRGATAKPWLAWGDAAALLLFTVLGLRFHKVAVTRDEVLQTAVPLWAAWFAVAALLKTYRRPGAVLFLTNWMVAVPLALLARQLWLGRPLGQGFLVFLGVALAMTLIFLGAWRIGAFLAGRVGRRPRPDVPG
ncbi:MAG: DUF3054 domain-containing protein [Armatimonadota bacterium]|nr:DUF3054 domain-containing protein [Armatimonadota bacterium]MDR7518457.1 DUF3054 domain-containing protein [Armatimonadota bacterium]MDR7550551.1 DUF3054 domain-containing protein [Armatimonadota bacterium]